MASKLGNPYRQTNGYAYLVIYHNNFIHLCKFLLELDDS